MRGRWNAITINYVYVSVVLVQPQSKSWARRSCTNTITKLLQPTGDATTRCSQDRSRYVLSHVYVIICGRVARAGHCGRG